MPEGCRGRVGVTLILISCDEAECWAYMKLNEIRGLGMSMTTGAAVLRQMRIAMLALAFYSRRLSINRICRDVLPVCALSPSVALPAVGK
jgi:hypothetical protein